MDFFDYGIDDIIPCEICTNPSVDVHHIIARGMGGSKTKDYIENLMALCRDCHDKAHDSKISKDKQRKYHKITLENATKTK